MAARKVARARTLRTDLMRRASTLNAAVRVVLSSMRWDNLATNAPHQDEKKAPAEVGVGANLDPLAV